MDDSTYIGLKTRPRERVDIRIGTERRRRWGRDEKLRIVRDAKMAVPGRQANSPGVGHNSGIDSEAKEQRRQQYIDAVTSFVHGVRQEHTLSAKQLGALLPFCRLLALRRALTQAMVELSRANPRADTTGLVLAAIMHFADNRHGLCTISVERMAELLGRSQGTVTKAIKTLEANGLVKAFREPGHGIAILPTVDTVHVGDQPVVWLLDAYAPRDSSPKLRGRWREIDRQYDNSPLADMGGTDTDSPQGDVGALADSPHATQTTAPTPPWGDNTVPNNAKREETVPGVSLSPEIDRKYTATSALLLRELNGYPWIERIKQLRGGSGSDADIICALNSAFRRLSQLDGAPEGRMKLVLDELDAKSAKGRATADPLRVLVIFGQTKNPTAADAAANQMRAKAPSAQTENEYIAAMQVEGIPEDLARANWKEICRGLH